ncbi:hypothetical protein FPV67DRAFT_216439 [Lyophyllum atratum]|nr:hypothetical protein FPV67DRAFT_216439 [Lyophyllum atratum]
MKVWGLTVSHFSEVVAAQMPSMAPIRSFGRMSSCASFFSFCTYRTLPRRLFEGYTCHVFDETFFVSIWRLAAWYIAHPVPSWSTQSLVCPNSNLDD